METTTLHQTQHSSIKKEHSFALVQENLFSYLLRFIAIPMLSMFLLFLFALVLIFCYSFFYPLF